MKVMTVWIARLRCLDSRRARLSQSAVRRRILTRQQRQKRERRGLPRLRFVEQCSRPRGRRCVERFGKLIDELGKRASVFGRCTVAVAQFDQRHQLQPRRLRALASAIARRIAASAAARSPRARPMTA